MAADNDILRAMSAELGVTAAIAWTRRHLRALIFAPLVTAVLVTGLTFVVQPRYASSATILPESKGLANLGNLAGLAGQFGFSLPSQSGDNPQFYAEAGTSRSILVGLLTRRFDPGDGRRVAPLIDLLDVSGRTPAKRLDNGVKLMRKRLSSATHTKSGTLTFDYEGPTPQLSKAVLDSLLVDLNTMNLKTRRTQAGEKSRFLEDQTNAALAQLHAAEGEMQSFREENRGMGNSPALQVRQQQIQRTIDAAEQLYSGLQREYEAARVQELDEMPVFSVVDPPYLPGTRTYPNRPAWIVFGMLAAILAMGALLIVRDYLRALASAVDGDGDRGVSAPVWRPRAGVVEHGHR